MQRSSQDAVLAPDDAAAEEDEEEEEEESLPRKRSDSSSARSLPAGSQAEDGAARMEEAAVWGGGVMGDEPEGMLRDGAEMDVGLRLLLSLLPKLAMEPAPWRGFRRGPRAAEVNVAWNRSETMRRAVCMVQEVDYLFARAQVDVGLQQRLN